MPVDFFYSYSEGEGRWCGFVFPAAIVSVYCWILRRTVYKSTVAAEYKGTKADHRQNVLDLQGHIQQHSNER